MQNPLRALIRRASLSVLLLAGLAAGAAAQARLGRTDLLVTTDWLATQLDNPKLVLLHVGDKAEYDAGHIAGARFVQMRDVSTPPARDTSVLALEMPPADEIRRRLERLGISDDSRIVIYWGNDWVSPATRVLLTLQYVGLGAQASILDGGLPAWKKAGHPVTGEVPAARTGALSARPTVPVIVDGAFVKAHLRAPGYTIIDARNTVFYDGPPSEHAPRPGHIPGAVNLVFEEPFALENRLLPEAALRALFTKAGIKPNDTIIAYCHIGQQATAIVFAAQTLGYTVKLYDGSFQDWSLRGLPVESSRKAAR
ncbi:MAG TPA: rhodanese-like domain-containing protein [Gemmatimonadaceae bacterium]|jgi:thiosulfate/3-mercaptopyruvate sulfurtransferase|nr:rhodanese-like domain-containing protein [Gemmatimonadaceae bacterium]